MCPLFTTVYYHILHNHTFSNPHILILFYPASLDRGHLFTLLKPPERLDSSKLSFFLVLLTFKTLYIRMLPLLAFSLLARFF